jgi:hypothetical protein
VFSSGINWFKYAAPQRFYALSGKLLPYCVAIAVIATIILNVEPGGYKAVIGLLFSGLFLSLINWCQYCFDTPSTKLFGSNVGLET